MYIPVLYTAKMCDNFKVFCILNSRMGLCRLQNLSTQLLGCTESSWDHTCFYQHSYGALLLSHGPHDNIAYVGVVYQKFITNNQQALAQIPLLPQYLQQLLQVLLMTQLCLIIIVALTSSNLQMVLDSHQKLKFKKQQTVSYKLFLRIYF